jgi:diguanylate cyclase (GGDEF)-like protein
MKKHFSSAKAVFALMTAFGFSMGLLFPLFVDPFVVWNPDLKVYFQLACITAGLVVGISCFILIKLTLLHQKSVLVKAKNEFTILTEKAIRHRDRGLDLCRDDIPTCWRVQSCDKYECPVHGKENIRCWLIAGTFCYGRVQGRFAEKLESCTKCDVYMMSVQHNPMREIAENFNSLMTVVHEREQQLADANRQLQEIAVTDSLTGLKNHGYFQEQLAQEVSRASRFNRPLSLLMADLDHFKQINDNFGHQAGDRVLQSLGRFLVNQVREIDLVARYGGEEFVIILPDTEGKNGVLLADKLRIRIKESMPREAGIEPSFIAASFGVSDFPVCAMRPEELIKTADSALLYSKKRGRDRVSYFAELKSTGPYRTHLL